MPGWHAGGTPHAPQAPLHPARLRSWWRLGGSGNAAPPALEAEGSTELAFKSQAPTSSGSNTPPVHLSKLTSFVSQMSDVMGNSLREGQRRLSASEPTPRPLLSPAKGLLHGHVGPTEDKYVRCAVVGVEDEEGEVLPLPRLNFVFLIVGTHGDVLPFLGLAKKLLDAGHRVRLATHAVHRSLVIQSGVEHYPLGGDPRVLSKWMVKSGGTIIGEMSNVKPAKLAMLREIVHSLWPACTAQDPYDPSARPFTADVIIANPPTFGHIHCAEALGAPLHMMCAASPALSALPLASSHATPTFVAPVLSSQVPAAVDRDARVPAPDERPRQRARRRRERRLLPRGRPGDVAGQRGHDQRVAAAQAAAAPHPRGHVRRLAALAAARPILVHVEPKLRAQARRLA